LGVQVQVQSELKRGHRTWGGECAVKPDTLRPDGHCPAVPRRPSTVRATSTAPSSPAMLSSDTL
jgi:hypothetical protein